MPDLAYELRFLQGKCEVSSKWSPVRSALHSLVKLMGKGWPHTAPASTPKLGLCFKTCSSLCIAYLRAGAGTAVLYGSPEMPELKPDLSEQGKETGC